MANRLSSESNFTYKVEQNHILHYQHKLQYEIDAWDLNQALKRKEKLVVIDARSADAYQNEHIPGAMSFPWRTMTKETTRERLDFKTQYVTYCDGIGCNASTKSALRLAELGYNVKELIGGIDWWKRDGYPIANKELRDEQLINCGCEG